MRYIDDFLFSHKSTDKNTRSKVRSWITRWHTLAKTLINFIKFFPLKNVRKCLSRLFSLKKNNKNEIYVRLSKREIQILYEKSRNESDFFTIPTQKFYNCLRKFGPFLFVKADLLHFSKVGKKLCGKGSRIPRRILFPDTLLFYRSFSGYGIWNTSLLSTWTVFWRCFFPRKVQEHVCSRPSRKKPISTTVLLISGAILYENRAGRLLSKAIKRRALKFDRFDWSIKFRKKAVASFDLDFFCIGKVVMWDWKIVFSQYVCVLLIYVRYLHEKVHSGDW